MVLDLAGRPGGLTVQRFAEIYSQPIVLKPTRFLGYGGRGWQAGGAATNGTKRILDLQPTELHERTPLYIGSKADVGIATSMLADVLTGVGG